MPFQDALLHLATYPEPTSEAAIDQAVAFAEATGAKLAAAALEVEIPMHSNRVADYLIGLSGVVREEEAKSRDACARRLAYFKDKAGAVCIETVEGRANLYHVSADVGRRVRTRDLCLVALGARFEDQVEVAQTVAFTSGRPVIVFQPGKADLPAARLRRVSLAWDGSLHAVRAMSEALPLLKLADEVEVVTFTNEKDAATPGLGAEAARHLQRHGVAAKAIDVDAARTAIGQALDSYLDRARPELLVMGAYGHSRLQELVLGGATSHVLRRPKVALFLAH